MSANATQPFTTRVIPDMTVREYFAAQALPGLIAMNLDAGAAAKSAVEYADKLATALRNTPVPAWAPGSGPDV